MIFGAVPVAEAEGAILAHSVPLPDGRLRKGAALTDADLDRLRAAGVGSVTVARLGPDDVHEDAAAEALATALPGPGPALRRTGPTTGRANLYATGPGVFVPDAQAVHAINAIDPALSLATLPPFARVAAGTMLATVKIIAYAVAQVALDRAVAAGQGALAVAPPRYATATLIETTVGGQAPQKGRDAVAERLSRLDVALTGPVVVPHAEAPLTQALAAAPGEVLLILTGSATSDLHDVAPEALRRAGGVVHRYGMPVDPGNLLFHGDLGAKPVIGLPGCARSPAMNGADWILERRICGIAIDDADVAAMGLGGLLKEIPARGRPREA